MATVGTLIKVKELMTQRKMTLENIVERPENADSQYFLVFLHYL